MTRQQPLRFMVNALLVMSLLISVQAQTRRGPIDGAGLSPTDLERVKVGDLAPDFTLEDQDRRVVSLSSYRDRKAVVLVFYRGYW